MKKELEKALNEKCNILELALQDLEYFFHIKDFQKINEIIEIIKDIEKELEILKKKLKK